MSRIAIAWELGSNFGHLSGLAPLAEALRARGHGVDFIIRELHRGQALLARRRFSMLQAPLWLGRTPPLTPVPSYAGVIRRCGYHAAPVLGALVEAWIALFDLVQPDLVILDHAPTAALAASCCGVPCVRHGSGWAAPPAVAPLPSVTPWAPSDPRRLWIAESQVLSCVNAVLKERGRPSLARLADLFQLAGDVLTTFPETDHYGARAGLRYWGGAERPVSATPPDWPAASGPRLFGFLDSSYPGLDVLAGELGRLGCPTLLYVRDLPAAKAAALSTATLRVVRLPVDFAAAVRDAALVICHGGHGAVTGALRAGKPLLLLPRQAEQRMLSHRVAATGAALDLPSPRTGSADHAGALRRLHDDPSFAAAARALGARYAVYDPDAAVAGVADLCEAVLRGPAPRQLSAGEARDAL